jgi:hypothetical protein
VSNQHTRVLLTFLDKVANIKEQEEQEKNVNLKCSSVSSSSARRTYSQAVAVVALTLLFSIKKNHSPLLFLSAGCVHRRELHKTTAR